MSARSNKKRNRPGHFVPPTGLLHTGSPIADQSGGISPLEVTRLLVRQEISSSWSGPLPPPGALREFGEIIPDGANRIMLMAEAQSSHRMQLENRALEGDLRRSYAGLMCGAGVLVVFAAVGAYALLLGYPTQAATIAGIPAAGVIGAFIYGTNSRRQERQDRVNAMAQGNKPKK